MAQLVEAVRFSRSIRELVLRRAERRNALSIELLDQLYSGLKSLESDAEARVVILRGDGPVFSAGLDLREAADESLVERSSACLEQTFRLLRETPLVTIAAVQGSAYAGGAGLMAACDLVIAADDVRIGFPEVRRGLMPALISRVLQPKVRGGDLRDLFLVGEPIDAQRARELGLIQHLVPAADLLDAARRLAKSVVAGGPDAVRNTKRMLNALCEPPEEISLDALHQAARRSDEAREGLAAFLEKRDPRWISEETR